MKAIENGFTKISELFGIKGYLGRSMINKISSKERMAYYKSLPLWDVIEREIEELVENRDFELTTAQDIVVGSIIRAIESASTKR